MTRRKQRLRNQFVMDPDSENIATSLTRTSSNACMHGRRHCYLACGVQRVKVGKYWRWSTISIEDRRAWLESKEKESR